jgi:glycosyltransferase involved in cell wall biosynthesis
MTEVRLSQSINANAASVRYMQNFQRIALEQRKHQKQAGAILQLSESLRPLHLGPSVAILLCTYHGQRFLEEQLDSFMAQSHSNWRVFASDDGSLDDTHAILIAAQARWGKDSLGKDKLSLDSGPCEGFATNFLSLTCKADIDADYFAYSDQDDVWEIDKLERALKWLQTQPADKPALYCSRTRLVNEHNQTIGISPLFKRPPCFANALMQNVGGGNTMVFNRAARDLLRAAGDKVSVVTHDWWVYMVVSGCGGQVHYDPYPSVRYRQHANNLVGMNTSWRARAKRLAMLFAGRFKDWNNQNIAALQGLNGKLSPENRQTLESFVAARSGGPLLRLFGLKRSGVHRQTWASNVALYVAALLGKV